MKEPCFISTPSISRAQTQTLCSLGNKRAEKHTQKTVKMWAEKTYRAPNGQMSIPPQYMKGCREPKKVGSRNKN